MKIIYALAIFGALFIGFTTFLGDNQASNRKVLSEPLLMPLYVKYLEQEANLIEIGSLFETWILPVPLQTVAYLQNVWSKLLTHCTSIS